MASPFAIFRKHERILMATVGLMAILAFVFLGNVGSDPGGGQRQNPVAATTKYGKVTMGDLQWMVRQKELANTLLALAVFQKTGQFVQDYFDRPTPEVAMDTMILARKAADLGIYIGDDEITRYLRKQSGDRLKASDYNEILRRFNEEQKGRGLRQITKSQLYDILRTQMMFRTMQEMCFTSLQATPAERWDEYTKLKKRVNLNVVPVKVADFLSEINDPNDAKLTEFYEQYKNVVPQPGMPTPGFKIPAKAQVAYFKADFEQFKKEVVITDEEVADFYAKNKSSFRYRPDRPTADEDSKPAAKDADADKKTTEDKATDEKPAGEKPADEKPAGDPTENKPSDDKAATEKESDAKKTEEKPATEAPKQSSVTPSSNVLVSYVAPSAESQAGPQEADVCQDKAATEKGTENTAQATDAPPADSTPADAGKTADGADPTAKAPAGEAASTEPAKTDSADPAKAPGDSKPDDSKLPDLSLDPANIADVPDVEPLANKYELPDNVRDGPDPEFEPLWRVEKDIRDQLATQRATEKIGKVFGSLQDKMRRYSNDRAKWEARKEEKNPPKAPVPLDFAALAAENHLTAETTPLVSFREFVKLPGLGESFVGASSMLYQVVFGPGQLYAPTISQDGDGNQYLLWKTKAENARVPELKEIRADVVRAWKMIEARKPAREHADALAEQARRDKLSVTDLAKKENLPLEETGLFSWLTRGFASDGFNQMPLRLSEVKGVEDAGNDFMQAVMQLPLDGIGVAVNNPQTIMYVVQVTEFDPSVDVLRHSFLVDRYDYGQIGNDQRREAMLAWGEAVRKEADLKWIDKPKPTPEEQEEDAEG